MDDRSDEGRTTFEVTIDSEPAKVKIYRQLRVLEYIGTLEWIIEQQANRGVKGVHVVPGGGLISESFVGPPTLASTYRVTPKVKEDDDNPNPI